MKRMLTISFLLIILFSQCKKKREENIVGKWTLVKIESPDGTSVEQWTFDKYNNLEIIGIENFPVDTVKKQEWKYTLKNRWRLKLFGDNGQYTDENYKILKLDENVLRIQLIEKVSQTTYDFYKE
ncbi:MAG: hypothetical protein WCK02_07360 [Bacteroidota bacterium]